MNDRSETPAASSQLDRVLVLELVRVTEAAAIAASTLERLGLVVFMCNSRSGRLFAGRA